MKDLFANLKDSRGYAIIFSVVVIGVVVMVTLAVSSLVQKELELSSIGQKSMEAFFAADAGIECALYWDISQRSYDAFGRGGGAPKEIRCDGSRVTPTRSGNSYFFTIRPSGQDHCYEVALTRDVGGARTEVRSNGYNTCDAVPDRIERGLEVRY